MSRRTQRASRRYRHAKARVPDFARLYGESTATTPRTAYALWRAAGQLLEEWRRGIDDPDEVEYLLLDLPQSAEQVADRAWMHRFVRCLQGVRTRLATGDFDRPPACAGDELALFLVFDRADGEVFLWHLDHDPEHQRLPCGAVDEWFRRLAEILFGDTAVPELLQAQEDGGVYGARLDFDQRLAGRGPNAWFATTGLRPRPPGPGKHQ